jgi:hypothetical protein
LLLIAGVGVHGLKAGDGLLQPIHDLLLAEAYMVGGRLICYFRNIDAGEIGGFDGYREVE